MGMFDYVHWVGGPLGERAEYQTYDTPSQGLDLYKITREGRLIQLDAVIEEPAPIADRLTRRPTLDHGSITALRDPMSVTIGPVDLNWDGKIELCGSPAGKHSEFHEYELTFKDGQLVSWKETNP